MTAALDTRVLVLTPSGAGAIAVLRVRGVGGLELVSKVFRPTEGGELTARCLENGRIRYGRIVDGDETLDDVLVVAADTPGDPAVDVFAHGGPRVLQRLLRLFEFHGAVVVAPQDVIAADAWSGGRAIDREIHTALVGAKSERAVRFLLRQRTRLPAELHRIVDLLHNNLPAARVRIERLIDGYSSARLLLEGAVVALVGPPNSGKSTLFNRLVGRDAAIVSPVPGTTRDWVSADVELHGIPIRLIDTAGRRISVDDLEMTAIEAGVSAVARSSAFLLVLDGSVPFSTEAKDITRQVLSGEMPTLLVWNKSDHPGFAPGDVKEGSPVGCDVQNVAVSAMEGAGTADLARELLGLLGVERAEGNSASLFTSGQAATARSVLEVMESDAANAEAILRRMLA